MKIAPVSPSSCVTPADMSGIYAERPVNRRQDRWDEHTHHLFLGASRHFSEHVFGAPAGGSQE